MKKYRAALIGCSRMGAFIDSHQRGGARVDLPLEGSTVQLERDRKPDLPRYEP